MNQPTVLSIKNMVCQRCIRVVKEELELLGFEPDHIELGKVVLDKELTKEEESCIKQALQESGFELLGDKQSETIEAVKRLVIEVIHHEKEKPEHQNFSDFLSKELGLNYHHLTKLFSMKEGITIEKYIALQKIERVKEFLVYGELNIGEIAFDLGYSSTAHLSGQFKKITGLSPSAFRKLIKPGRKSLDEVNPKN